MRRYVIGYAATSTGLDALHLGISFARATGAELDIVFVLHSHEDIFNQEYPPTGTVDDILLAQAFEWIRAALDAIPPDITARGRVITAPSTAEGLCRIAEELDARLLILGSAARARMLRHKLGRTTKELVRSAPVPVALAPRGYQVQQWARVTCAVGSVPSSLPMMRSGIYTAAQAHIPLRLLALLSTDSQEFIAPVARQRAEELLEAAKNSLRASRIGPNPLPDVTIELSQHSGLATAVENASWEPDDIIFIGSSRAEEPRRVCAGSVVLWMLSYLTVPVVLVPREHED